jgi:hypothetical protein
LWVRIVWSAFSPNRAAPVPVSVPQEQVLVTRSAHPADSTSRSPEAGDDQAGLAGPQARQLAMELDYELRNSFERALFQCLVQQTHTPRPRFHLDGVRYGQVICP